MTAEVAYDAPKTTRPVTKRGRFGYVLRVVVASITGSLGSETIGIGEMAGVPLWPGVMAGAGRGVGTLVPGSWALATLVTLKTRTKAEARFVVDMASVFLRTAFASAR